MEDDETLQRYFAAFAAQGGTPPLSGEEARAVLDLARVVAHTAERHFAPLSAYLAGMATAGAEPQERARQVRALVAVAQELGR